MAAKNTGLEHQNLVILPRARDLKTVGCQKLRAAIAIGSISANKQYFLQTSAAAAGFG
jgi:hypothetical protein